MRVDNMMKTNTTFFTDILNLPHATTLGNSKAYITQGTAKHCCLDSDYHRHACYELAWITGEEVRYFVDFCEYTVPNGSLAFISPGQVHTWRNVNETTELTVIGFTPDLFASERLDMYEILSELPFFVQDTAPIYTIPEPLRPVFEQHFKTAVMRVNQQPDQMELLIRAYLNLILVEARSALATHPGSAMPVMPAPTRLTRHFRLAVEQHCLERRQVQDYADQLGVTTNYLVKTVRQRTGSTPKRIIHQRLLLEAKRMLAHSTLSIADVGSELSFRTPSDFGRWFKDNAGIPPGQFRLHLV